MVGELAGFAGGLVAAEAAAKLGGNEFGISLSSGIVDYVGSILGFLAIFYRDNSSQYRELARSDRFRKIMQNAFSLWPSVILADIAYIIARPYIHYLLLLSGFEAGIAATIAHFAAFGVFNGIALLSRSVVDYLKSDR